MRDNLLLSQEMHKLQKGLIIWNFTRVCLTLYSQRAKIEAVEGDYDWDIKRVLELMRDIIKGMDS